MSAEVAMDARVWFGAPLDTARAWGPDPGPAPTWSVAGESAFDDASDLGLDGSDDDATADPLDAEGVVAGAVDAEESLTFGHHTEVVPYYQSEDYIMFQANQAYLNGMYGTNNAVDWNLNGIAGY